MTQDERWNLRYQEVMDFIEINHRNPSKHRLEEHDMLNWLKQQRKLHNPARGQVPGGHWRSVVAARYLSHGRFFCIKNSINIWRFGGFAVPLHLSNINVNHTIICQDNHVRNPERVSTTS